MQVSVLFCSFEPSFLRLSGSLQRKIKDAIRIPSRFPKPRPRLGVCARTRNASPPQWLGLERLISDCFKVISGASFCWVHLHSWRSADPFKILPGDIAVNQGAAGENKLRRFKKTEIRRLRSSLSVWYEEGEAFRLAPCGVPGWGRRVALARNFPLNFSFWQKISV